MTPAVRRAIGCAALLPILAAAHVGEPLEPHDLWTAQAWILDPFIVIPLVASAVLYARGSRPLWRGESKGRGIRVWEARCYWAGWIALAFALVSPLHAMGEVLFSAHMTQHEVLMLSAAPLLVLGRPLTPDLWGLPLPWRRRVARPFLAQPFQALWTWTSRPFHAWWLHGVALWIWHIPALYQATVQSDLVHALQHASFLFSALLFWWALIRAPHSAHGYGAAALYVFGTAVHSSILGALLTFAPSLWYPVYADTTYAWGLSALEDQQIGGLIMWVPAGVLYTVAGLILIAAWLRESESRSARSAVDPKWADQRVSTGQASPSRPAPATSTSSPKTSST